MLLTVVLTDVVPFVSPPAVVENRLSTLYTNTRKPVVVLVIEEVCWRKC